MANPHKGEVAFKAGEDSYMLSFSANALANLEDDFNMSVQEISALMQDKTKFRIGILRKLFLHGLCDHHDLPESRMTQERVNDIMKKMLANEAIALIGKAFQAAFPAEAGAAKGVDTDPQKPAGAAAGTGLTSAESGNPSA